jgi:hypothetical protein
MGLTVKKRILINNSYENENIELLTINECLNYINLHVNEKYLNFNENILSYLNDGILNNKIIPSKTFHRTIKKLTGGYKSKYQILFWVNRGYSRDEAEEIIKKIQSENGLKFSKKIKENPKKYEDRTSSQLGWWFKKGYTEEEAKEKLKERQQTFSLKKCIQKYGLDEGSKKFNDRNKKWLNSRKKSLDDNVWGLKDQGKSFSKYFNKHGDDWLTYFINYLIKKQSKEVYINICKDVNYNKHNLLNYILNMKYEIAKRYFLCGPVNFILKKNSLELKELWCKHNNVKFLNTKYGNISYVNGNYYQSVGEYELGMYFELNNILFDIHVKYPNSKRICDFYLPEHDMYIEYMGMNGKDYNNKIKELANHNIIWSKDINFIKKIINEKIYRNK